MDTKIVLPCSCKNEILFPVEPPQIKLKNYKRSWKRHTKRLDLQAISSFHVSLTRIYAIMSSERSLTPRTLHDNKMEEESVASFIGNKSMEEASVTAFTGTN
jgi:hypothetical protein